MTLLCQAQVLSVPVDASELSGKRFLTKMELVAGTDRAPYRADETRSSSKGWGIFKALKTVKYGGKADASDEI